MNFAVPSFNLSIPNRLHNSFQFGFFGNYQFWQFDSGADDQD
jgi:hypothetical protein